jgi:hypothetical protein
MAQYVVHKIGFFFNDDNYEVGQERGNVMGITQSLEEAKAIKYREDIESMKGLANNNAVLFFLEHPNYEEIYKKLQAFYQTEYGMYISTAGPILLLPDEINNEQAAQFLSIMELTFHNIVVYADDEVIDPKGYDLTPGENNWF